MTDFPTADVLHAVAARIAATGESPNDYDVLGIVGTILHDYQVPIAEVNDHDFLLLLTHYALEDQTELPCPEWCTRGSGHPFESSFDDGRQSRPHGMKLAGPAITGKVYLSLVQEEVRNQGDDSTADRLRPEVSFAVDASFQSGELRKIAAALLDAADELDGLGGGRSWTEDDL